MPRGTLELRKSRLIPKGRLCAAETTHAPHYSAGGGGTVGSGKSPESSVFISREMHEIPVSCYVIHRKFYRVYAAV